MIYDVVYSNSDARRSYKIIMATQSGCAIGAVHPSPPTEHAHTHIQHLNRFHIVIIIYCITARNNWSDYRLQLLATEWKT